MKGAFQQWRTNVVAEVRKISFEEVYGRQIPLREAHFKAYRSVLVDFVYKQRLTADEARQRWTHIAKPPERVELWDDGVFYILYPNTTWTKGDAWRHLQLFPARVVRKRGADHVTTTQKFNPYRAAHTQTHWRYFVNWDVSWMQDQDLQDQEALIKQAKQKAPTFWDFLNEDD